VGKWTVALIVVLGLAGAVGAGFTVRQYYATPLQEEAALDLSRLPTGSIRQPAAAPMIDLAADLTTAASTKAFIRSSGQSNPFAVYSVTNHGWGDDMTDVRYSLWVVTNGRVTMIDESRAPLIAKGNNVERGNIKFPVAPDKLVICVSYMFKTRRVNVVEFYSNEKATSVDKQTGELTKFRPAFSQVDRAKDMCTDVPAVVANLI
jgi:hypothetical protein